LRGNVNTMSEIKIEIRAVTGNSSNPAKLQNFKRTFIAEDFKPIGGDYCLHLSKLQAVKLDDFFHRMNLAGGSETFFFHLLEKDKWVEAGKITKTDAGTYTFLKLEEEEYAHHSNFIEI
jgi:hypothetical protein